MEYYLDTTDNQFGFKKGSPVYTCFLDASETFDRVNHWTLFRKLLNRGVPVLLMRILLYWYRTQYFVLNGVPRPLTSLIYKTVFDKVGFCLPTYLMYDLSNMLNSAGIGCHIHNCCTKHIFYADDLCVIAPSPSGLQALLNMCAKFSFENDIKYNPIKSICMVIKPRGFHLKCPDIYMNNNKLVFVKKTKYLG